MISQRNGDKKNTEQLLFLIFGYNLIWLMYTVFFYASTYLCTRFQYSGLPELFAKLQIYHFALVFL